jgi:wyosine [tRNA(Phe)-imidazoG37] synthetase (radical SAM superfamily)
MKEMKFVYGPVPSRRLGISLGISPIPKKTCNYSCIYCQLGRTNHMLNTRQMFFTVEEIMVEFDEILGNQIQFDVITIVGEGEPTLYLGLGQLILEIKKRTDKPIAVITNGALLSDAKLRGELYQADIVLPTLDAFDEESFKRINRPHGKINFNMVHDGLVTFSKEYQGQLWLELMLMQGINDDENSLNKYAEQLKELHYDRLYINTPIRPPAEAGVSAVSHDHMSIAVDLLGGISIDLLESEGFHSEIEDHYEAILSIIKRHPMNQFEIIGFLKSRGIENGDELFHRLKQDSNVAVIQYKGYDTYRLQ